MHLVVVLCLLAVELQIERDLIALIDHIAMAPDHPPDMETPHARDRPQVFLRPGEQRVGGSGNLRLGPEDHDMGKHNVCLREGAVDLVARSKSMPPAPVYRFCFGPWNLSEGADPYGPPTRSPQSVRLEAGTTQGARFRRDDVP
jgi:hypothetical protein